MMAFHSVDAATQPGRAAVTGIKGTAEYRVRGETVWHTLKIGMVVGEGISFQTGKGGRVDLEFTTGALARVAQNSLVSIDKLSEEVSGLPQAGKRPIGRTEISVQRGQIMTEVAKQTLGSVFRVHTAAGDVDVKGTQLAVSFDPATGRFTLAVLEGTVTFNVGGQQVTVTAGNQITGTFAGGQASLSSPTPVAMDPAFSNFLNEFTDSGIRDLVVRTDGPVDLDGVIGDAYHWAQLTGQPAVILNITNPVIVSPYTPVQY